MLSAPLPDNEEERLEALYGLNILDTIEEQAYDDLTFLSAQICGAPIALISLIDRNRQCIKSHHGFDITVMSRELGLCPYAILDDELTIIEDASKDERFHDNPLVTGEPHIKFYAGAPLIFSAGVRIGALCIIDTVARTISPDQQKALEALARQVVSQLEQRQAVHDLNISNKHRSDVLTKLKNSEARERARSRTLEKLAKGCLLSEVLESIVYSVEDELEESPCSILLLDDEKKHLLLGAAPNLPTFYNDAIHNMETGPMSGSCGTAAHTGQRVIVEDIQNDPYWEPFKALASKAGLAACWSEPIHSSEGELLGTFAIYHTTPQAPDDAGISVIEHASKLAAIAIQRKREEQVLRTAKHLAENASKAKSQFLSSMSHELRTPLNAIIGFGQLLKIKGSNISSEEAQGYIKEIMSAGYHLLDLINEVLDLSRIEAGHLNLQIESIPLNPVLTECLAQINAGLADQLDITLANHIDDPNLAIMADSQRIRQVLTNLLSNAVKYNNKGGSVAIKTELVGEDRLRIVITDTGIGIATADIDRLFDPFERLSSSYGNIQGTGIGLTVTKTLVEAMSGNIGVNSIVDQGSSFWVELPSAKTENQVVVG
ncbi:MAG: GAF domain-containing protein [Porticoccus sp.]|nr:GAF domain-containing protein [Porticoccus sp.]MBQ0807055.1 GAF domain-containing protein [Porticoccus sp.]